MGFFDYFNPQQFEIGRAIPGWLDSMQKDQMGMQPGGIFGGSPEPAQPMGQIGQQALPLQTNAPIAAGPPVQPPAGNPSPPGDIPSQYLPIGDYRMPQIGAAQASQSAAAPTDLGDRLSAGFKSWAYTPVGNPFAALANAITGFSSGQFATAPNAQLRSQQPSPQEDTAVPSAPPGLPAALPPNTRMLVRRNVLGRR